MDFCDTIAAVSTPRGKGGVALIRVSGPRAFDVAAKVFRPRGKAPSATPRRAAFGAILSTEGNVIDEGLCTCFPAPASFTGEDVAELSCHGGVLLTETVLSAVFAAGARPATAGEFTRRALANGKISLSAAEALGALLDAETAGQLALARGGMAGRLADTIRADYDALVALLADCYAKIDFPDEDLNVLSREQLTDAFEQAAARLSRLLTTYRAGHAVGEGLRTVICGPVNAGKSTLYNALVGQDAAIVTDVAGTTRDVLSQTVSLGGATLRLSDTAGLRQTADAVERIGVERTRAAMAGAELILAVFDRSRPLTAEDAALSDELRGAAATVVIVLNKTDLPARIDETAFKGFSHVVRVNAAAGEIAPLADTVQALWQTDAVNLREDAVVANARQYAALSRAAGCLSDTVKALRAGVPLDSACTEAEEAVAALGEVDGRTVAEDVIADIFSHFCVGK